MRPLPSQEEIMLNWKNPDETPWVSIDCATFNHEAYIEDALEGFLIQKTDFPFHIVIHDDASTDKTADIIREYVAAYPKLFDPVFQKKNIYQQGIKRGKFVRHLLKGKYVAKCEGDDYWTDPLKLQKQVELMEQHPECDLCFHASKIIDFEKKTETIRRPAKKIKRFPVSEVIKRGGGFIPTASILVRFDPLKQKPAWLKEVVAGDYFGQILNSLRGGALYLDRVMSVYRKALPGSWTTKNRNWGSTIEHRVISNKYLNMLDEYLEGKYAKVIKNTIKAKNMELLKRLEAYLFTKKGPAQFLERIKGWIRRLIQNSKGV